MASDRISTEQSLIRLLVIGVLLVVATALILPVARFNMAKGQLIQTMNNGRLLYISSFQMATDATSQHKPHLRWPGDLAVAGEPGVSVTTVGDYILRLVDGGYFMEAEIYKVLHAPGIKAWSGRSEHFDGRQHCAFKLYRVRACDKPETIFCATQNFTYGRPLDPKQIPFKNTGFVLIRKGGDGATYKKQHSQVAEILGLLPGRAEIHDRPQELPEDTLEQR